MKTLTLLATLGILAICSISTAMPIMPPVKKDTRVLSFDVITEGGVIAAEHFPVFMYPSLVVNYATDTVSLNYMLPTKCKAGLSCPAVMQVDSIDLPIVSKSISDDGCSVTVIAKVDQRPVDGLLQQITVDDFSKSPCQFFVKPISNLTYQTAYYNRIAGHEVNAVSKLKADLTDIQDQELLPVKGTFTLTGP